MGVFHQVILLLWKDLKLIQHGKLAFFVEIFLGILGAVLSTLMVLIINGQSSSKSDSTNPRDFLTNAQNFSCSKNISVIGNILHDDFSCLEKSANSLGITLKNGTMESYVNVSNLVLKPGNVSLHYEIVTSANLNLSIGWWYSGNPWGLRWWLNKDTKENYTVDQVPVNQYCFDQIFIKAAKNSCNIEPENDTIVYFAQMPSPPRIPEKYLNTWGVISWLSPLWAIFYLLPIIFTVKEVLAEKEAGIKTYLMIMGMRHGVFYLSHFIFSFAKMLAITFIVNLVVVIFLFIHNGWFFMILCLLYGFDATCFALLITTLFQKSSFAYIMAIVIWIGLIVLAFFVQPNITSPWLCTFISLSPTSAFSYAVTTTADMAAFDQGVNFIHSLPYVYSTGASTLMIILDGLIMFLLTFYLDLVLPTDDSPKLHPLFFIKWIFEAQNKIYDSNSIDTDEYDQENIYKEYMESEENFDLEKADIEVYGLAKKWSTGEVAVKNVSFRAYRDQITVLLGHNGAGKSTTFACLSGFTRPTKGIIKICGKELLANVTVCRRQIGYCPQFNPIFGRLTVKDHLHFYGNLKHDTKNGISETELYDILEKVGLNDYENKQGSQLSGGMKRKLCVGMAMVGQSRVLLLDEPTAGMDPTARQQITHILQEIKKRRTILLTTHYMDEASAMGDRIAIMAKGELFCNGSEEFLHKQFKTGYILTISFENSLGYQNYDRYAKKVIKIVKKWCNEAILDGAIAQQFKIALAGKDKNRFPYMFDDLETQKATLGIHSFGLSANTLEQVFLKVGDLADPDLEPTNYDQITSIFSKQNESLKYGVSLILLQITTLFHRYFLYHMRHWIRVLMPYFIIIGCIGLVAIMKNDMNKSVSSDQNKDFNLRSPDFPLFTFPIISSNSSDITRISNMLKTNSQINLKNLGDSNELLENAFVVPPLGIGVYENETSIVGLYQQEFVYGQFLANNFISNMLVGKDLDTITFSIHLIRNNTNKEKELENNILTYAVGLLYGVMISIGVTVLISTFIFPLIAEHKSKFRHQLLITKMHSSLYWLVQAIGDFGLYLTAVIPIIIFMCAVFKLWNFSTGGGAIFATWILYFWISLSMTYCLSHMFKSEIKGFCFLLAWNFIVPIFLFMGFSIVLMIVMLVGSKILGNIAFALLLILLVFLFPSIGLMLAVLKISIKYGNPPSNFGDDGVLSFWLIFVTQFIGGLIYWAIIILMQSSRIAGYLNKKFRNKLPPPIEIADPDVLGEKIWVENETKTLPLKILNLCKFYKNYCAVKGISFGVLDNDCFGLLGVNGAGKTTTFDMLTGVSLPSSGLACINGFDVMNKPSIGYCPQFDALLPDLTGLETLKIIGKLNGIPNTDERAQAVLESLQMAHMGNKLVKHYSGGQKRRISIGVALMSNSRLILLDEPTAGVDPRTRRRLWDLLTILRKNGIALLLTSHSMEECEALCTRIGFMNQGLLLSIGTIQSLKDRYGDKFILTLTVNQPENLYGTLLDQAVVKEFNAYPTKDPMNVTTLTWEIPKQPGMAWSRLYKQVINFVEGFIFEQKIDQFESEQIRIIQDFSLVQSSLEQVFVSLAKVSP